MRSFIVSYKFKTTDFHEYYSTFTFDTEEIHPAEIRNRVIDEMNKDLGDTDCLCSTLVDIWEMD